MALDTIDVSLSRILYHEPSKWSPAGVKFLIAKTSSGQVVKGELRKVREGERLRLWGSWAAQKGRSEPAFEFVSHEILVEEGVAGVVQYLRNYVDGLGLVKATAIVEALGADALRILRTDPDRALAVPGITPAVVANIRSHFDEDMAVDPAAYARLVDLFAAHRFPRKVVLALLRDWGSDAPAKVVSSPYMLLAYPRMGWKGVDAFALDINGAKYDPKGIDRQVAAIVEGLERISDDGHTYGTRIEVEAKAFELIGRRPEELAWNVATIDGLIVKVGEEDEFDPETWGQSSAEEEAYGLPKLVSAERKIANHVARLMKACKPISFSLASDGLSAEQQAAVKVIEQHGVSILAGPPGTGKSYTLAAVIARIVAHRAGSVRVVAPTGKAAKRAAELLEAAIPGTSIECSTIHKALGVATSKDKEGVPASSAKVGRGRDEFGFKHGEGCPLKVNFLVVDEMSMCDARLTASLLSAVATGTRVIFVGDPNQLPSVGPGSVLRDLLAAGVPAATLSTIQRSDGGGRVVRACHAIKDGRVPEPATQVALPTENWVHVEEDDPSAIAAKIVEMHESVKRNGKLDPLWDMQVVSAQKKGHAFACEPLNAMLGRVLNPKGYGSDAIGDEAADAAMSFGPPFRVGDKVIRKKNGACDEMKPLRGAEATVTPGRPTLGSPEWFDLLTAKEKGDKQAIATLAQISKVADDYDYTYDPDEARVDWRWRDPRDGPSGKPRGYSLSETAVVNGDMGQVIDIVTGDKEAFVVVQFRTPDRLCRLPMGEHHLIAAYALTCHSVQGSGFPYVIVPVHHAFYWDQRTQTGLFSRELIYTAISRAERLLVTVGQFSAIRAAVGRRTIGHRRTRLAGYVGGAIGGGVRETEGAAR